MNKKIVAREGIEGGIKGRWFMAGSDLSVAQVPQLQWCCSKFSVNNDLLILSPINQNLDISQMFPLEENKETYKHKAPGPKAKSRPRVCKPNMTDNFIFLVCVSNML